MKRYAIALGLLLVVGGLVAANWESVILLGYRTHEVDGMTVRQKVWGLWPGEAHRFPAQACFT